VLLRPGVLTWRLVGRGALGAGTLAFALAPILAPYVAVHQSLGFDRPEALADWFGMDLLSALDPGAFSTLYRGCLVTLGHSEGGLFPGFAVLALAGAALILAAAPDRAGRADAQTRQIRWIRWVRAALLTGGGLCLLLIVVALRRSGVTGHLAGLKLRAVDLTLPLHALPVLAYAWTAVEGRGGARERLSSRDWLLVLGPATLVMYLLTLTPTLTVRGRSRGVALFHWVYEYVPGAAAFRAPGRWVLVFVLPLALIIAIALAALTERLPRRARLAAAGGVLLIVMLECLPLPIPWQRRPPLPAAHRWLAGQPGDFAVAVLPATDSRHAAWAMLWATTHWKRLVNGAFVFVPPAVQTLADEEDAADAAALAATLRSIYPLRYALVDWSGLSAAEAAAWTRLDRDPRDGITFVGRFGRDDVFEVEGTPQEAPVLRRWFSADFVRRHPRAEYSLELSGADPDARRRIEVRFNDRLLATLDGPGRGTVNLAPPYRTGDRNELTFTHRYDLDPRATGQPAYRIGRTAVQAPVDIEATSATGPGGRASLRVNGLEQLDRKGRGYVIAVLDPRDGQLAGLDWFDTFRDPEESGRMARRLDGVPAGAIVVALVRDEGTANLSPDAVRALAGIGARANVSGRFRAAHVVIGAKGAAPGDAIEETAPEQVRAAVGRARPLALVLEAFDLR
jgi:interleukin-like EMT inducer protein